MGALGAGYEGRVHSEVAESAVIYALETVGLWSASATETTTKRENPPKNPKSPV